VTLCTFILKLISEGWTGKERYGCLAPCQNVKRDFKTYRKFFIPLPPDAAAGNCYIRGDMSAIDERNSYSGLHIGRPPWMSVEIEDVSCLRNKKDVLKIAVIERHHRTGRIGLGFVKGFGLKGGAIASTVCHDAHNLIIVGANDEDMLVAANALKKCGGGFVAVNRGKILGMLPLPVAGLMSPHNAERVAHEYEVLNKKIAKLGPAIDDPFLTLSFLALSVVPKLRIEDRGLLDVTLGKFISLSPVPQ
jgi:hypothetical protein